jgi:hypothetical protein
MDSVIRTIKIGDRVSWWAKLELKGTVEQIYLTSDPFYVKWDDGRDDWYNGKYLVKEETNENNRKNQDFSPYVLYTAY